MIQKHETNRVRGFVAACKPAYRRSVLEIVRDLPDIEIVGQSGDGWETLEEIHRLQPSMVFMDTDMSGLSGIEVARRVNDAGLGTQILIFSGCDDKDTLVRSLIVGARGFVLKGDEANDMPEAIKTINSGDVFVSHKMLKKMIEEFMTLFRSKHGAEAYESLSERELEVFHNLAGGKKEQDIAASLGISPFTVQTYRKRIMNKLSMHSKAELMKFALRKGITQLR